MGTNTTGNGKHSAVNSSRQKHRDWLDLYHLLDDASYEKAATHFQQILAEYDHNTNPALKSLIAAAHQLCLLCRQYNTEVSHHQKAFADAAAREEELRQQLMAVLNQLTQQFDPTGEIIERETSKPENEMGNGRSWWQRLKTLWQKSNESSAKLAVNHELPQIPYALTKQKESETTVVSIENESKQREDTPALIIYCLGPFQVFEDEHAIEDWSNGKGKSIFKYLITHRQHPVNKEVLMNKFWPDASPDAARNNLNVAIYSLRQALRNGYPNFSHILFQNDSYLLNPELQVWIDIEEFSKRTHSAQVLLQRGQLALAIQEYHAAEELYRGEFLMEDRYDEWLLPFRQSYQDTYLGVLDHLSRYYFDIQDYAASVTLCHKMLAIEPCREDAHRRLMRSYCRQKQHYLALRQYHQCVAALKEELDVEPDTLTAQLYEGIRNRQPV